MAEPAEVVRALVEAAGVAITDEEAQRFAVVLAGQAAGPLPKVQTEPQLVHRPEEWSPT